MDWNLIRTAFVRTAIALPIVAGTGDFAIAQEDLLTNPLSFTIENFTQHTLEEFYVSPTSVDTWENDRLGENVVPPGATYDIFIDDNREDCLYDVLGVFSNGDEIDQRQVDLCINEGTYTYYDENDLVFTFENQSSSNIVELYFTPQSDSTHGDDLLGEYVLQPQEIIEIPIAEPLDQSDCIYDFLAISETGAELSESVDICQTDDVVFSDGE